MGWLVCWLEVENYNELVWQDKSDNQKIFTTLASKDIVDNMIQFRKKSTDYFINNDINIDWNSCTVQFRLKDMIDYGDSAIISFNSYDGFQISTTNALGRNKLRLNKYGGRVELIKQLNLATINNFITCVFSNDFIGISVDDGEMIKQRSDIYQSKIFNKICIGNNTKNSYGSISCKLGTILIYNRVLSEEEIKHNYLYQNQ